LFFSILSLRKKVDLQDTLISTLLTDVQKFGVSVVPLDATLTYTF